MTTVIQLEGLAKKYRRLRDDRSLVGALTGIGREHKTDLWALRGIDLAVERGETIGIIGRNGSGKTTLLKILAGVTQPSAGRAVIVGRVAPLIGLGVGFRGELSGRDNVILNGMLLGLDKPTINSRFEEIAEFSELGNFIETPVKFYSSGMFLRLAFAVAIHSDPDILLVDEILAVGDLAFQGKCFLRIREIKESGTTIVLVSHSMQAIRSMSSRVLLLRHGEVELLGDPEAAVGRYHELLAVDGTSDAGQAMTSGEQMFLGGATIVDRRLVGPEGQAGVAHRDRQLTFELHVRFDRPVESPVFGIHVRANDGTIVYAKHSPIGLEHHSYQAGETAVMSVTFMPRLAGGTYLVTSHLSSNDGRSVIASDTAGLYFFVEDRIGERGLADLEGQVIIDGDVLEVPDVVGSRALPE